MQEGFSTAPPIAVLNQPTRLLALILGLLAGAGALVCMAAALLAQLSLLGAVVLLVLPLLAAGGALRFWRSQKKRILAWDGVQWLLLEPGRAPDARRDAVQAELALDWQHAILLCCRSKARPGHRQWLWLQRDATDAPRWHALRCALHAATPDAV